MSIDPSQNLMLQARSLIEQRRYSEARNILVGIDNPTARDWVAKIDEIALQNPFRGTPQAPPPPAVPSLLQPAVSIMTRNDWEVVVVMQDTVEFRKRKGPSSLGAALLIVLFSLVGTLIVCAGVALSGVFHASIRDNGDGTLTISSKRGTYRVSSLSDVEHFANSVKKGATYGGAIALGIITFLITYFCIFSGTLSSSRF